MRHSQSVDDGNADNDEQVGHFTNRHHLGAITNHTENGEQTEREAHAEVDVVEQKHQHEHRDAEQHESVVIIRAFAFAIIEEMDDDPANDEIEYKEES